MNFIRNACWMRDFSCGQGRASIRLLGRVLGAASLLLSLGMPPALAQEVAASTEWITAEMDGLKQSSDRWIEISISEQLLTAWEGDNPIYSVTVSTGRGDEPTLPGVFSIQEKYERAWMQGEGYDIPNVPFTMYYSGNYAIHGAYWHSEFGSPVSSGCVNLPLEDAAWLFNWADVGTPVVVEP